ncbi:MAG: tRNA pseudouridine(55) synthase TruB [Vicinamibacteria bacterium]
MVVDKPVGPTSHDVVDAVRRALGLRRVGHTGTLDPFASGVLPVCVGQATRLARFLTDGEKAYRARVRLGFATDTDDLTGTPLGEPRAVGVDDAAIRAACARLVGTLPQVPPSFSAKKVDGRRSYELARAGLAVPREAVVVTVHAIDLVARAGDALEIEVRCAAGTYVRALARDLGAMLGTGAHLTELRRARSGGFGLEAAVPLDRVGDAASLRPLDALLPEWPSVRVGARGAEAIGFGRPLTRELTDAPWPEDATHVRVLAEEGTLLAIAVPRAPSVPGSALPVPASLHPEIVFAR